MKRYIFLIILCFFYTHTAYSLTCFYKKNVFFDQVAVLDEANCNDLRVGESKVVNIEDDDSPTDVSHKYILEKVSEKEYKVKLNLVFTEGIFNKKNTLMTNQMEKKVRDCLSEINPHLIGPDGQKMSIEILNKTNSAKKEYDQIVNKISVYETMRRASSKVYGLNTSCETIAHELLHLMGLVDEYEEREYLDPWEKMCRTLGPADSIMRDHGEATGSDPDGQSYENKLFIKACRCQGSTNCKEYSEAEKNDLTACPRGYSSIQSYVKFTKHAKLDFNNRQSIADTLSIGMGAMMGNRAERDEIIILSAKKTARPENSYLYPAQFRAITQPLCKKANKIYYGCSKGSYDRKLKLVGSCSRKPIECNDPAEWLK